MRDPKINKKSLKMVEEHKIPPIHQRYKEVLRNKASNLKKLEVIVSKENAMKDPENANPKFRPNLVPS